MNDSTFQQSDGSNLSFQKTTQPIAELNNMKPWTCDEPYHFPLSMPHEDPWMTCQVLAQKHDIDMCDSWRDEVDKLLIFAGLFSAAVTAFTVESYKALQEDPFDISAQRLTQIVAQLDAINGLNTTMIPSSPNQTPFVPSSSAIRVNILWFLSLTLSLTTVLIGILCMQWIREYRREGNGMAHKDALALRQMRYEGLMSWKVPSIVSGLPLLLQAALVLFFAGLLDLLWSLNHRVAIPVTVVVGVTLLFLLATTLLPTLQCLVATDIHLRMAQCPFKSPQSWALHRAVDYTCFLWFRAARVLPVIKQYSTKQAVISRLLGASDWSQFDLYWRELRDASIISPQGVSHIALQNYDSAHGLIWLGKTYIQSLAAAQAVTHCILTLPPRISLFVLKTLYPNWRLPHGLVENQVSRLNQDIHAACTLEYFVDQNPQLQRSLFLHRIELYIRITNHVKGGWHVTDLMMPVLSGEDIHLLPNVAKLQLLSCVRTRLMQDDANEKDWYIARSIIPIMLEIDHRRMDPPLRYALQSINTSLECLVNESSNETRRIRLRLCLGYVMRFHGHGRWVVVQKDFPEFFETFVSLIRCLDKIISETGFPSTTSGTSRTVMTKYWRKFVAELIFVH